MKKSNKFGLLILAALLVAAGLLLAACGEDNILPPRTGVSPIGPGTGSGHFTGGGASDVPGAPGLTYGIGFFPTPAAWNAAGEMYDYPNIFVRGNGKVISDPLEWEAYDTPDGRKVRPLNNKIPDGWRLVPGGRREEVKKLLEYYLQGSMPPPPETITLTSNTTTGANRGFGLTFTADGRTATYGGAGFAAVTITIPDVAPNGLPPSPTNKVPLFIGTPTQPMAGGTANGWATMNLGGSTDNYAHAAQTLYNYDINSDPNRPSAFMLMAWNISRIMDAIEMFPDFVGGVLDSSKIACSGVSRNGKAAMYAAIWAESQKGTRVAISIPASSGALGANVERWTSQKAGLNRQAKGHNQVGLIALRKYNESEADSSVNHILSMVAPRLWPEGREPGGEGGHPDFIGGPVRTQIQNWQHAMGEQPSWRGNRLSEFAVYNPEFAMTGGLGSGVMGSAPFDTHFAASLAAPNVYMGVDGWTANSWTGGSGWVSQAPVYMTYLLTRELYDFLGVPDHCTVFLHRTGHAWPAIQVANMIDYANWFFNEYHHPEWKGTSNEYKRQSLTWEKATVEMATDRLVDDQRTPVNNVDWYNPLLLEDFLRVTWKNPNRTKQWQGEYPAGEAGKPIADNVRAYFRANREEMVDLNGDPITLDYPASVVEMP